VDTEEKGLHFDCVWRDASIANDIILIQAKDKNIFGQFVDFDIDEIRGYFSFIIT